jgi:hypothetical protein
MPDTEPGKAERALLFFAGESLEKSVVGEGAEFFRAIEYSLAITVVRVAVSTATEQLAVFPEDIAVFPR